MKDSNSQKPLPKEILLSKEAPLFKTAKEWLHSIKQDKKDLNINLLSLCCEVVDQANDSEQLQYSLMLANELHALNCDIPTIATGLIYHGFQTKRISLPWIEENLGALIKKLISGVSRMDAIHLFSHNESAQVDNLRKMSLAIVDDIRIVLIKLVERFVFLKSLRYQPAEQQQKTAKEIMNIYAPLANRLGIGQIKWRLEDLAFRYLETEQYSEISKALKMRRADREQYIEAFITQLSNLLKEANIINANVSGRAKHIYSISRKIKAKRLSFEQVYDTSAVRILVSSIEDCYTALSIVHTEWPHIAKEFNDYIAKPKPNGYRSIHTVIIGPNQLNIEIQIRTYQIHDEAERGIAAHWKYKEKTGDSDNKVAIYEEKINLLRNLMDWQKEVSDTTTQDLYQKIFEDRIYVFTPAGDVFDLEAGATPLDFAYHIHTDIGHRCRGAKVNGQLVSLTHSLKTGDQVSISTQKIIQPSRDWLNPEHGYLKTDRALQKVRAWFRKQSQQEHLLAGEVMLEKFYRREKMHPVDLDKLNKLAKSFNLKNSQDLLIALGAGDIGIQTVINRLKKPELEQVIEKKIKYKKVLPHRSSAKSRLIIEGVDSNLLTQLARCCKPIPGDAIIGYVTKGRGVSIHQQDCQNIHQSILRNPEKVLDVHWGAEDTRGYPVEIAITAEDRSGLIKELGNIISHEKIPVLELNNRINRQDNLLYIHLIIEIKSLTPLRKIFTQIQQITGIKEVKRL